VHAANDRLADAMTAVIQLLAQVAQPTIEPFLRAHRVPSRMRSDKLQQHGYERRIFFSRSVN
jgi:hypothetical protein